MVENNNDFKVCISCKAEKKLIYFSKDFNNPGYRQEICKQCKKNINNREYYHKNKNTNNYY